MKLDSYLLREACRTADIGEILGQFAFAFGISKNQDWAITPGNLNVELKWRQDLVAAQIITPPAGWLATGRHRISKIFEWSDLHGFNWTYISPLESSKPLLKILHPAHGAANGGKRD